MDLRIGICDDKPEWLEKAGDTVKRCAEQMQKKSGDVFLSEWQ